MISTSTEVLRVMGVWVRRADAGLARGAARNAADSAMDNERRRMEDLRTLRDLAAAQETAESSGAEPAEPEVAVG